jgi:hypothetical protein
VLTLILLTVLVTVLKSFLSQAALKAAKQSTDGRDAEVATLRTELEVRYANSAKLVFILISYLEMSSLTSFFKPELER